MGERGEKSYLCLVSPEGKATGPSSVATGQQVYDKLGTCLSLEGDPWLHVSFCLPLSPSYLP